MTHSFMCRSSDIRRVGIACRCGERSIAEVPQQLAVGYMIHPCPKCGALFEIHQEPAGPWEVKRLPGRVDDMVYAELEEAENSTGKKVN